MIAISPKINIIAKRKVSIAIHERERNQLPQSDTAKDVHAAWTCRKSRKRCGQDYERLAFPRMAQSKREGRDTPRLRSPINADRKTGQEERTDKKDSESKIGQEKPFITNESQENPARKPDKKTRQENPTRKPDKKEQRMQQILSFCQEAKSFTKILELTGLKDRESFKHTYIDPLIAAGKLRMTEPDNPTSRNQKYISTQE